MTIGHATVVETEPLDRDRTMLTFRYGTRRPADNDVTVDVLEDDEWVWQRPRTHEGGSGQGLLRTNSVAGTGIATDLRPVIGRPFASPSARFARARRLAEFGRRLILMVNVR